MRMKIISQQDGTDGRLIYTYYVCKGMGFEKFEIYIYNNRKSYYVMFKCMKRSFVTQNKNIVRRIPRYRRKIFFKGEKEYTEKTFLHISDLYPDIEVMKPN